MDYMIIIVSATLVVIGLISYFLIRRMRKDAWEGELTDKREETADNGDYESTNYTLYVKLNDGTTRRIYVRKKLYQELHPGDKLLKVKGKTYPTKAN